MIRQLTCVECPMGCTVEVKLDGDKVLSVQGNGCPRGKMYAETEVVCPKRVVTSTVRAKNGAMVPVKTDRPVKKSDMFEVMEKIRVLTIDTPVKIGQIVLENVSDGANLVVSGNVD